MKKTPKKKNNNRPRNSSQPARPYVPPAPVALPHPKFMFGEAFRLMMYVGDKTGNVETLWNSRDGVTPFTIPSVDGEEAMTHQFWAADVQMPFFIPPKGMRIFTNLTREKAIEYARKRVELNWENPEYPMKKRFSSQSEAVSLIVADELGEGGSPDIVTVDGELHRELGERAKKFCTLYWSQPLTPEKVQEAIDLLKRRPPG